MHLILFSLLTLFVIASACHAQDALGGGHALDNNLSATSDINPSQRLPVGVRNNELRDSGVMQGRGFNEGIGRARTSGLQLISDAAESGDDDAYLDALNNSPWYWDNWNQQSAQFLVQGDKAYFNPTFLDEWSTAPKQMEAGRHIRSFSHEWSKENVRNLDRQGESSLPEEWSDRQVKQFQMSRALGDGSQKIEPLDTTPIQINSYRNQVSVGYLTASPMSGIAVESSELPYVGLGFSTWDEAYMNEALQDGTSESPLIIAWRQTENRLDQRTASVEIASTMQYDSILSAVANATTELANSESTDVDSLNTAYSLLQEQLTGIADDEEEEALLATEDVESTEVDEAETFNHLGALLRHGEKLTQLSGVQDTRFNEIMRVAEMHLAKGEYFLAQRKFNQALRFIPGHPLATAGLAHSNLGAGLHLSAGNVLQSLLSFQPEMIDVRYDANLLPPRIELVRAGVTASQRLDQERDGETYAFLLAYIGHQLEDEEMLNKGLTALIGHAEEGDPFIPLLNRVWGRTTAQSEQEE
ncbi:MAG: hypothetical protein MK073_00530 [Phycisphaerales bacterium]|nr:hypothetical protein [Phycisphaerales bacterium]